MSPKHPAVLRVSYDIDQNSGNLLWRAEASGGRNLMQVTGRFAGALHFEPGDAIGVEVFGYGPLERLLEARVLSAHLITRPHSGQTRFSAPSPFSTQTAVVAIPEWTPVQSIDDRGEGLRCCFQESVQPLPVVQDTGSWELSFAVTVAIALRDGERRSETVRAFFFDPECEVGPGNDPNR